MPRIIYEVYINSHFAKESKKIVRKNRVLNEQIIKTIEQLQSNPYHPTLKTHLVSSRNWGETYSSRVTKDIRILWRFDDSNNKILLLELGGHSGSNKVYDSA